MPLTALPRFIDDVDMIVSSETLAIIRDNIALCDALSFRPMPLFDNGADEVLGTPGSYLGHWGATQRLWWGALRFRTGLTTLSLLNVNASVTGSETITVYINGVSRLSYTPTNGSTTKIITISGLGFADSDIFTIECVISGTWNTAGTYSFWDVYAGPVVYGVSYPSVPSFSGTYTAAKLNQLVDATAWLYGRMAQTPIIPGLAHIGASGPYAPAGTTTLYAGAVQRSFSQDALRIQGGIISVSTVDYLVLVYVGGSLAYTSAHAGIGYLSLDLTVSLSGVTIGTRAEVLIKVQIIDPGPNTAIPWRHLRFSLFSMRADGDYPYSSALSAPPAGYTDTTQAGRDTLLSAYASAITAIKTRLDNTLSIWGVARAMRMWYDPVVGRVDAPLAHRFVPRFFQRLGDRVLVRGKGLKIGWGPISAPVDTEGDLGYDHWVPLHEESATDADTLATNTLYLDSYQGLYPGSAYLIDAGLPYYAEELL